jgi:hypothetical protein
MFKITKSDQILEEDELHIGLCQNKDNCCLILLTLYNLFLRKKEGTFTKYEGPSFYNQIYITV